LFCKIQWWQYGDILLCFAFFSSQIWWIVICGWCTENWTIIIWQAKYPLSLAVWLTCLNCKFNDNFSSHPLLAPLNSMVHFQFPAGGGCSGCRDCCHPLSCLQSISCLDFCIQFIEFDNIVVYIFQEFIWKSVDRSYSRKHQFSGCT
jgi:hypothetical protein